MDNGPPINYDVQRQAFTGIISLDMLRQCPLVDGRWKVGD